MPKMTEKEKKIEDPKADLKKEREEREYDKKTQEDVAKACVSCQKKYEQEKKALEETVKTLSQKDKDMIKADIFVRHIEAHLTGEEWTTGDQVVCKICNKTINEIFEETEPKDPDKPEEIKPGHPDYPVAIGVIKGLTPIPEKEKPKEPEEEEPDYDGDHEPEPNDIIIYDDRLCPQCAGTRWNVPAEGEKWSCDSCGWESDELPPIKPEEKDPTEAFMEKHPEGHRSPSAWTEGHGPEPDDKDDQKS